MRRLDNRGFAFSTILYGLMLLGIMIIFVIMSTMQTNRQTNKEFVTKIEEELNRYSLTEANLSSSGTSTQSQEYIVPIGQSGWYKIELWGAAGGGNANGGYGSYTSGIIWLEENRHLYFYIGNSGNCGSSNSGLAKYNFNGAGRSSGSSCNGGGATDVRLRDGAWNDNLEYRIMVAAGGGGSYSTSQKGGAGGGFYGYRGRNGGTYTSAFSTSSFGKGLNGPSGNSGGGGGGYYGGTATANTSGGGGSSYISGYAGSRSVGRSNSDGAYYALNKKAVEEHNLAVAAKNNHTYDVGDLNAYFLNGFMLAGVNSSMNGKAKIQKISDGKSDNPPAVYNTDFNKTFNKVTECYSSMTNNSKAISEIQVMYHGKNLIFNSGDVARNGNTGDTVSMGNCVEYSISPASKVDEVAVWHYGLGSSADGKSRYVKNHSLTLTATDGTVVYLSHGPYSTADDQIREMEETTVGLHYSPWNPRVGNSISDGIYYIQSAIGDNLFLTKNGSNVLLMKFTGDNNQKWSITSLGSGYYKISSLLDMNNSYTLQIKDGASYDGSAIGISEFVGSRVGGFDWEKWKFQDAGVGTFYISSGFNTRLSAATNDYAFLGTSSSKDLKSKTPVNGGTGNQSAAQRFKLINASY
ncbi:MAG: RICIN domain-containing protein [Bacilli bacterium]|nr:RICIN domain-containing protein [Bacilli bacterium]